MAWAAVYLFLNIFEPSNDGRFDEEANDWLSSIEHASSMSSAPDIAPSRMKEDDTSGAPLLARPVPPPFDIASVD